jgi:hypothetical protein
MQIVPVWPTGACKFPSILFMLLATGGHAGTICMRLAATQVQKIYGTGCQSHANFAASTVQSRQFFASTLQEQLYKIENEDAIKKSENPRDTCAC